MPKPSSQKIKKIVEELDSLEIPFCGRTIESGKKKYHLSHFPQITISGIGPIFYLNKKNQKIYTLLQRRFKDNFQWWFPGGYVELPPAGLGFFAENFEKIKNATIDELYKNAVSGDGWQKAKKEINDPKFLEKSFKKHKINFPKEVDANWQAAWQREVLEETGVNLDKFPQKIILDFKFNHTLMIGAERDRLTNIDGKFCAFLGELDKEPKSSPDHETEELRWIALDEISFDKKKKNYFAHDKIVNLYTATLIEESLFEIICHNIKQISKVKNPITKQEISRFNNPQNIQAFLIKKNIQTKVAREFLSWEFGELEIGKNLCGKSGDKFYHLSLQISKSLNK
jgi:ADP-ribose pyrophosphatase YjhB (NUDIX family)